MTTDWKLKAKVLAETTDLTWREIARRLDVPWSSTQLYLSRLRDGFYEKEAEPEEVLDKARILLFDIETAPSIHYAWKRWEENASQDQVIEEGYLLTWAAKWLGEDTIVSDAIWDYKEDYQKDPTNDKNVCKSLYDLINEADIIIGHNGDNFDKKTAYTRFLFHGFQPPKPTKTIDTLKVAKRCFKFPSNSLANLAKYFGLSDKIETGGFSLWKKCLEGNRESQQKMVIYNEQDVLTLEELYLKLRAWDDQHPNVTLFDGDNVTKCVVCGSEKLKKLHKKVVTGVSAFDTYRCKDCGKVNRQRTSNLEKDKKESILTNAGR